MLIIERGGGGSSGRIFDMSSVVRVADTGGAQEVDQAFRVGGGRYDNLLEVDKLAAVISKVESVKLVLQENVQVALANCVTLENIEKAAGEG